MTNSKNKGSKFERVVSKFFESWTGYKFSRTPGSGGWAKAKDSFGDITCVDPKHGTRFPLSIECKSYNDIRFEHILLGNKTCKILEFWEQACRDADKSKKVPMLIMKYNGMPSGEAFVVLDKEMYNQWVAHDLPAFGKPVMGMVVNPSLVFYIAMLSDIRQQDYKTFYKVARKLTKERFKDIK